MESDGAIVWLDAISLELMRFLCGQIWPMANSKRRFRQEIITSLRDTSSGNFMFLGTRQIGGATSRFLIPITQGMLITDDYGAWPGARKATDE